MTAIKQVSTAASISSGAAVCRILAAAGIRRVYTVPGESFLDLLDEVLENPELDLVSTRHESGAAFMAEAEAKLTGIPAVAAGTRGVGAANLAIGVHTAYQDSTPMLVLVGQAETDVAGREAFQEIDLPAFYGPITKWAVTVNQLDRLPELLARGIITATSGRHGPVMLALPADVLRGRVLTELVDRAVDVVTKPRCVGVIAPDDLQHLIETLAAANRPVLIAGRGVRAAGKQLIRFAELLGLGVFTAFRQQDVFPSRHEQYLGHLAIGTPASCLDALDNADVVLVLGTRLDEITTQRYRYPRPNSQVIRVDAAPEIASDGTCASWSIQADPTALVRSALDVITDPVTRDWTAAHACYLEAATPVLRSASAGVDPAAVIATMARVLPADSIITSDAGNFSTFLHLYWPYSHGRSQLAPISGAMGYGVPAAVAAAIAGDGRLVVGVCGDGGFLMSGQELETAVRYGLNLLIIVMRNGLYGTIAMHQAREFGRVSGVDIGPVDLAAFARSLGALGTAVRTDDELTTALQDAVGQSGVRLVDVSIDADLITPSKTLSNLVRIHSLNDRIRESELPGVRYPDPDVWCPDPSSSTGDGSG